MAAEFPKTAAVASRAQSSITHIAIEDLALGAKTVGGFGIVVSAGTWKGAVVAIKELHNDDGVELDDKFVQAFRDEAGPYHSLGAERDLIMVYGSVQDAHDKAHLRYMLVVERLDRSLSALLHDATVPLLLGAQLRILYQIVVGLGHLHDDGIAHGDLRSDNVLMGGLGNANLCDFGTTSSPDSSKMGGGTFQWMAPEQFPNEKGEYVDIDPMCSDVYSFGVVMWEVLTRQTPYADNDKVKHLALWGFQLRNGVRPNLMLLPSDLPPPVVTLMTACWETDPSMRPSVQTIVQQLAPFFDDFELARSATCEEKKHHPGLATPRSEQLPRR